MFVMICIVTMPFISTFEFDNIKSYDPETKTITIKNAFGLGDIIAEVKLNTPLKNIVPRGYRKVAEFTITNYEDYNNALKELELFDKKKDMNKFTREYDYKYLTYENIEVNDYVNNCIEDKRYSNNSQICSMKIIGTHLEEKEKWINLNPIDLKKNDIITIGIFTDVKKGDSVEWIPNMFGVRINEWAGWAESLNVGLVFYHDFNETTGTNAADRITGLWNGTRVGDAGWNDGIVGNSAFFDGDDKITLPAGSPIGDGANDPFTVALWVNRTGNAIEPMIEMNATGTSQMLFSTDGDHFRCGFRDNTNLANWSGADDFLNKGWYHAACVFDGVDKGAVGSYSLYINGTLYTTGKTIMNAGGASSSNEYGADGGGGGTFSGVLDESGVWNRTLSAGEISDVYDYYLQSFQSPSITIFYPTETSYLDVTELNYSITNTSELDSCWYTTNGGLTNTTTICGENITGLSSSIGSNTWEVYANYSAYPDSPAGSDSVTFTKVYLIENSQTYTSSTVEGATNDFIANITYTKSDWNIISGILTYNNTNHSGVKIGAGNNILFNSSVISPPIDITTNISFYWTIRLTNTTGTNYINLTSYNQTVDIINMSICGSPYTIPFINFTFYDEDTLEEINGTISLTFNYRQSTASSIYANAFSYTHSISNSSRYNFCINPPGESYTIDSVLEYTSPGYTNKFYNFQGIEFTNITTEIGLYLLNESSSTSFIIEVKDSSYQPMSGVEVYIQRYDSGENRWVTSEITETDVDGVTIQHIFTEDALYRFKIYNNGVLLHTTSPATIACPAVPCTVTIIIKEDWEDVLSSFGDLNSLESTLTYDENTNIVTYIYTDNSENFIQGRLYVIRSHPGEVDIIYDCNETSSVSTAVLNCDLSSAKNGTYTAVGYITRHSTEVIDKRITFNKIRDIVGEIGLDGVLWSFFILMGIVMIGVYRPSLGIFFAVIGVVLLWLLQLMEISYAALVAVIGIGVILLIEVKRQ